MGTFKDAFDKIADGVADLSSLEVVTYKGQITIDSSGAVPTNFDDIIKMAKAEANFQITACTYVALDGDMRVFYDKEITGKEIEDHRGQVEIARTNRQAVLDLFKDAILKQLDKLPV